MFVDVLQEIPECAAKYERRLLISLGKSRWRSDELGPEDELLYFQ